MTADVLRTLIAKVASGATLSNTEAAAAFDTIMDGHAGEAEAAVTLRRPVEPRQRFSH